MKVKDYRGVPIDLGDDGRFSATIAGVPTARTQLRRPGARRA